MRYFEKISFEQFKKDIIDDEKLYNTIELPKRSTKSSAGYDIRTIQSGVVEAHSSKVFKTGLKVCMNPDEVLLVFSRSSHGYKNNVRLSNCVGVIDSDYYNNVDNEGHFSVKLRNDGDVPYKVEVNDKIAQGIFVKYLTVDEEAEIEEERKGGFGSTNR